MTPDQEQDLERSRRLRHYQPTLGAWEMLRAALGFCIVVVALGLISLVVQGLKLLVG